MPYKDPKQAKAIFLDIKRRQGLQAAKAFGRKHRDAFRKGAGTSYKSRSSRSS